jgi:hypothetical protein
MLALPSSGDVHSEEVHRHDGFPMVTEKCKPAFRRLGISRCFARWFVRKQQIRAQEAHQSPGCFPGRIFGDHCEDRIANLLRDSTSATAWPPSSRQTTPVQLKSGSVPLNNGFGTDEEERLVPIGPDQPSGDPEQFVELGKESSDGAEG